MDVIVAGGGPAGLMTAALLDVAGVRVDVYERGSKPTRQFRGTALHPRTLEALTMFDAGDGRRISDVLLAQGRRVLNTHCAGLPDLLDYRGLDAPLPFTLTLPQWGTEHAPARYLGARGVRVRARPPAPACPAACPTRSAGSATSTAPMPAIASWPPGRRARQEELFTMPGLSATLTGISVGAHGPSWLARTCNTGRRDAASGLERSAMRTVRPDSHGTRNVTATPGRELRYHRPGKRSSCPPRPTPAGPRTCSR